MRGQVIEGHGNLLRAGRRYQEKYGPDQNQKSGGCRTFPPPAQYHDHQVSLRKYSYK
jgi:hypothetical protein